jgi:RNA polymerase sigma-70 factor (ECF subfamily)
MEPKFSEPDAIRSSQQGDIEAFNLLILHYQDFLFRVALHITGNEDTACDAVQEACVLLFKKISSFHGGSFRGWLARIVTNVCYDELRRKSRHQTQSLEFSGHHGDEMCSPYWLADFSTEPESQFEINELSQVIESCLQKMSPEHRMILRLIDMEDLSYEEAAVALRIPIGTIKSRLARARIELRKRLQISNYLSIVVPGSKTPIRRISLNSK